MFKLIATDCDNTLLDSTANIPAKNTELIKKLSEKGLKFILATGRNDILVKDYMEEMEINAPVIGCNGATIRNFADNSLIRHSPIKKESLINVFGLLERENVKSKAFSLTHGYSDTCFGNMKNFANVITTYTKVLSNQMIYENVDNMCDIADKEILKVIIVDNDYDFLSEVQGKLKTIDGIDIVRSAKTCIDVVCEGVSKGSALACYAQMCGIKPNEIIAFGDSENDLSMIEYAGMGIAMENGEEAIKKKADKIAPSNNDGGVGKMLEEIFSDIL